MHGHLAALFTILVWGITFISTKVLLQDFTALEITFYRLVLAVFALLATGMPKSFVEKPKSFSIQSEWKIMLAGLCGVTLYFVFQNLALAYTLTSNVGVLISAAPLFIALISFVVLREKPKKGFFPGFMIAMVGISLIAYNGNFILKLNPLGDVLSILAALVWAVYSVTVKSIESSQSSLFKQTRKIFLYGLLFLLPLLPFFGFRFGVERLARLPNLLNLFFLGVIASALCFGSWNFAVRVLGPVRTSLYIYMIPVITTIASVVVLHEPITLASGIGIVLILAGMVLSER